MIHYLILAHNNLDHLELLIKKIKTSNSEIYVHIDKKISKFDRIKNIHYIENRQKISWGGTSMLKTELMGISEIFHNMKEGDHIVLISGQCYPIKNINYIEKYIQGLKNKSCMSYEKAGDFAGRLSKYYFFDLDFHFPKKLDELIFSFVGLFTRIGYPHRVSSINHAIGLFVNLVLPKRKYLLNNYEIYKGDQRMVLSYNHIQRILKFLNSEKGKKTLSKFKYTSCSDEMFFQTIMINNKNLKKEIENKLLRYIVWEQYANSPNILTIDDFENIKKSDKLFARKFDINFDKGIVEKIDEINNNGK